ncbi:hypothetical protein ABIA03_000575 [Bradyrhizobium yuanmingense]|uniref:PepSY domain-containing protein n=2 Tax=Bradyrhizobium yuanmingense TaxID=108015 RepID=A0ABV4GNQ7_9BRAD
MSGRGGNSLVVVTKEPRPKSRSKVIQTNSNHFESHLLSPAQSLAGDNNMKRMTVLAATLLLLGSAPAGAQSQPAQGGPGNNAVNSSDQNNSNAPVAGRNSFTEGQAKSRIEGAGYSNVSGLQKDDNGVWRGKADKAGTKTDVSVDFQGNVNPAK